MEKSKMFYDLVFKTINTSFQLSLKLGGKCIGEALLFTTHVILNKKNENSFTFLSLKKYCRLD